MTRLRAVLTATTLLVSAAPIAVQAQPLSGLYIGAGVGYNLLTNTDASVDKLPGRSSPPLSPSTTVKLPWQGGTGLVGSIGYGAGNGIRLEVEGAYRSNAQKAQSIRQASNQQSVTIQNAGGYENKAGLMANVFYDFNLGQRWIFPYVGAGFGYQLTSWTKVKASSYGLDYGGYPTTVSPTGTIGQVAYQFMLGSSFPVSYVPGLSITTEYRFMGMAGSRNYSGTGSTPYISNNQQYTNNTTKVRASADNNHSIFVGFRYAFDPERATSVAIPAQPAAPYVPQAQMAMPVVRTYLIFFDFDRADLTPRARDIVAEAVRNSARMPVTRIDVQGHADRAGSGEYNQRLSMTRAETVAQELQRWGVPREMIDIRSFGDTRPLVPTSNGLREPQNRRVEIVYR